MEEVYECPICSLATKWYSNDRLIAQGWAWRQYEGETRIVCERCAPSLETKVVVLAEADTRRT